MLRQRPRSTLFPYTTLFRSIHRLIQARIDPQLLRQRRVLLQAGLHAAWVRRARSRAVRRSEEHTSELQSRRDLVCRLLLEKKKTYLNGTQQVEEASGRLAAR